MALNRRHGRWSDDHDIAYYWMIPKQHQYKDGFVEMSTLRMVKLSHLKGVFKGSEADALVFTLLVCCRVFSATNLSVLPLLRPFILCLSMLGFADLINRPFPLSSVFQNRKTYFSLTRVQGVSCLFSSIDFAGELPCCWMFADSLVFSLTFRRTLDV